MVFEKIAKMGLHFSPRAIHKQAMAILVIFEKYEKQIPQKLVEQTKIDNRRKGPSLQLYLSYTRFNEF